MYVFNIYLNFEFELIKKKKKLKDLFLIGHIGLDGLFHRFIKLNRI